MKLKYIFIVLLFILYIGIIIYFYNLFSVYEGIDNANPTRNPNIEKSYANAVSKYNNVLSKYNNVISDIPQKVSDNYNSMYETYIKYSNIIDKEGKQPSQDIINELNKRINTFNLDFSSADRNTVMAYNRAVYNYNNAPYEIKNQQLVNSTYDDLKYFYEEYKEQLLYDVGQSYADSINTVDNSLSQFNTAFSNATPSPNPYLVSESETTDPNKRIPHADQTIVNDYHKVVKLYYSIPERLRHNMLRANYKMLNDSYQTYTNFMQNPDQVSENEYTIEEIKQYIIYFYDDYQDYFTDFYSRDANGNYTDKLGNFYLMNKPLADPNIVSRYNDAGKVYYSIPEIQRNTSLRDSYNHIDQMYKTYNSYLDSYKEPSQSIIEDFDDSIRYFQDRYSEYINFISIETPAATPESTPASTPESTPESTLAYTPESTLAYTPESTLAYTTPIATRSITINNSLISTGNILADAYSGSLSYSIFSSSPYKNFNNLSNQDLMSYQNLFKKSSII